MVVAVIAVGTPLCGTHTRTAVWHFIYQGEEEDEEEQRCKTGRTQLYVPLLMTVDLSYTDQGWK
jgi:hypothetical protein